MCKQEHGEPFLTWWERKMIKAQEGMIDSMTVDNWLELELIRGVNDQNLQKRILREHNPMLLDMVSIATLWQCCNRHGPVYCRQRVQHNRQRIRRNKQPIISTNIYLGQGPGYRQPQLPTQPNRKRRPHTEENW